jgi:hypothetical protein
VGHRSARLSKEEINSNNGVRRTGPFFHYIAMRLGPVVAYTRRKPKVRCVDSKV